MALASCARPDTKCFNCGKAGHVKDDCWSRGRGKEGKGPERSKGKWRLKGKGKGKAEQANAASTSKENNMNDGYTFLIATDFSKVASQQLSIDCYTRLLDSGASHHFDPCCDNFVTFHEIPPKPVNSADGHVFYATATGNVHVRTSYHGRTVQFTLKNVLYAPTMPVTLISISQMAKAGFPAHFQSDSCHIITPASNTLLVVAERNGLYPLLGSPTSVAKAPAETAATTLSLTEFYQCMGHAYSLAL